MTGKKERIAIISALLSTHPYKTYTLRELQLLTGASRSSLSEDVAAVRAGIEKSGMGTVETVVGAAGGIVYRPGTEAGTETVLAEIRRELSDTRRVLPGAYLYHWDIFSTPRYVDAMACVISGWFQDKGARRVVTMETKGIPLAVSVARFLGVPLAIARHESRLTDGPALQSHYVSGASRRVQTISIPRRLLEPGSPAVIVDDFIGGGGTIHAISEVLSELEVPVVGVGVAIVRRAPARKKISGYNALFSIEELSESEVSIAPFAHDVC